MQFRKIRAKEGPKTAKTRAKKPQNQVCFISAHFCFIKSKFSKYKHLFSLKFANF
jgi:hypothetical protein